jgi:hypothetical protein
MSARLLPSFAGFDRPQDNFYRLPYSDALDWFKFWRDMRAQQVRRTVLGPLKVAEYVIKHTWGQLEFHNPVALSISNFEHGGRYRFLTDAGTGLQRRPIIEAIRFCNEIGLLDVRDDKSGVAHTERRYRIKLSSDQADTPEASAAPPARLDAFTGFPPPDQNYFIVPKFWTDLTSALNSDVLILTVEYLFCHCWNWSRERRAETRATAALNAMTAASASPPNPCARPAIWAWPTACSCAARSTMPAANSARNSSRCARPACHKAAAIGISPTRSNSAI